MQGSIYAKLTGPLGIEEILEKVNCNYNDDLIETLDSFDKRGN